MSEVFESLAQALAARAGRLAQAQVEKRRAARREGTAWRSAARLWPLFARGE